MAAYASLEVQGDLAIESSSEDEIVITLGDYSSLNVTETLSIITDTTVTAGEGASLTFADLVLEGTLSLDNVAISGTVSYATTTSEEVSAIVITSEGDALSGSIEVDNSGDGKLTAVDVSVEDVVINYDITATSTGGGEVIALEVTNDTGTVTLADGVTITSGDVAIENEHTEGYGLNIVLAGTAFVEGAIVANSPLTITAEGIDGSYTGVYDPTSYTLTVTDDNISTDDNDGSPDDITIIGATLITSGTVDIDLGDGNINLIGGALDLSAATTLTEVSSITMTTGTDGTMSTVDVANADQLNNKSIIIVGSASMLKDDELTVSNSTYLTNALADGKDIEFSVDTTLGTKITVTSLTYFQNKADTDTENESALAYALDNISVNDGVKSDLIDFKVGIDNSNLSDYVMSSNSYIAEINTMLLSNANIANVNRARSILAKSANAGFVAEKTEVEVVEEATGVSVVESEEIAAIKYSNVAQLQSINLLGSKDANNGVAGYDYWSVGATANFDKILSDNALVGASIGGTYNKVEGDAGDNANSTTFLLNAYGVYANEGFEAFANIGYAHFWNEGSKNGASADWDSDAFNFLAGVSYELKTNLEGLSIIPVAMLNLVYQDADSASYSNGVTVDDQSYFSAKLMFGFEVEYAVNAQFNVLARAMYAHEMGDDTYDFTYGVGSYISGVNYQGSSAGKDSALMGLGLSYDFSETCTAYFDYNAYVYESLITHSLNLSVALKF